MDKKELRVSADQTDGTGEQRFQAEGIRIAGCRKAAGGAGEDSAGVRKRHGEQQSRHVKDTLLQIHEQITQRWQNALANEAAGQIARDYLSRRGVSAEAIKLFRLGYAPD